MSTALVLSAGGMFGAYQAGAWDALHDWFQPDLVVGASIGSINGWAIAGGCPPGELCRMWLELGDAVETKLRFPAGPLDGIVECANVHARIREIFETWRPRVPCGIVLTDLFALRPRLFREHEVTWQHLAASCAVLGLYTQMRVAGRVSSDGGLLGALPVWAAGEMGARRALAINVLRSMPLPVRAVVGAVRAIAPRRTPPPAAISVQVLAPPVPLGGAKDAFVWNRENVERWIAQGRRETAEQEQSLRKMF